MALAVAAPTRQNPEFLLLVGHKLVPVSFLRVYFRDKLIHWFVRQLAAFIEACEFINHVHLHFEIGVKLFNNLPYFFLYSSEMLVVFRMSSASSPMQYKSVLTWHCHPSPPTQKPVESAQTGASTLAILHFW